MRNHRLPTQVYDSIALFTGRQKHQERQRRPLGFLSSRPQNITKQNPIHDEIYQKLICAPYVTAFFSVFRVAF